jgi:hypothetical protein
MPYTDPGAVTTGTTITSTWGNAVRNAEQFLANPPIVCAVNGSGQTLTSGADTALTFTAADEIDTDNMHSTSTSTDRLVMNTAGVYIVSLTLVEFASNATGVRYVRFYKNSATLVAETRVAPVSGNTTTLSLTSPPLKFTAGQWIQATALQNSGGNLALSTGYRFGAHYVGLG